MYYFLCKKNNARQNIPIYVYVTYPKNHKTLITTICTFVKIVINPILIAAQIKIYNKKQKANHQYAVQGSSTIFIADIVNNIISSFFQGIYIRTPRIMLCKMYQNQTNRFIG